MELIFRIVAEFIRNAEQQGGTMKKRSLGMIETKGYVPAVEAIDVGTKAANVTFLGYEITKDALVSVKFIGDVASVKAAVTAGAAAAKKVGKVVAVCVIPRPDPQLRIEPTHELPPPVQPSNETRPETKPETRPEPAPSRKEDVKVRSEAPLFPKGKEKKPMKTKPIKRSKRTK